jgi:asparagine synthase (glutamine-hydrolysing)
MCGIVGIAGRFGREQLQVEVRAMTDAIVHRGPDDVGTWVGDNFAFGMRRLSIIDLAGGHQPMWDRRTGTGIVYNGEVYNYKDIRADLQKRGAQFQTTSDTEVVLQGLALEGSDAIHRWNGMFAVAAWNDRQKRLLLVRDRIGVKPLYYYWDGAVLMFASEVKALLASKIFERRLNPQAVWDYLTYKYVPGPETVWQNVWKLPPGHLLEWSPGGEPRVSQYWGTDVIPDDEPVDIEQKTKEFEELFLDSVSLRLLASDVPVGVMLSGGLDSSAIAAAAVELGHRRFHTFSVGFADGGDYSELGFARTVAEHLGLENHEVVVDQRRYIEMLPEAVRAADEPLADPTIVPLLAVSRLTHGHVKVALSGEGSDEILAGYDMHLTRRRFEMVRRIQRVPSPLLMLMSGALRLFSAESAHRLADIARVPLSRRNILTNNNMTWCWSQQAKASLWPTFAGRDSAEILRQMYGLAQSPDPLDQMLSVFQKSWLVEDLLMKADKMSMAASLELRVPFLDYRLVTWANRQPTDVKIGRLDGRTVTKRVLRRFAAKRLPRTIIDRPKRGFPVPMAQWLADARFARWTEQHLTGTDARLKDIFQVQEIRRQLQQAAAGDKQAANNTWILAVLETWLREYDVDVAADMSAPAAAAVAAG